MQGNNRAQFATRLGVIATTVGSAVGLGNIWRFPYEAGVHGGGAFLLIYIGFIFIIGVPGHLRRVYHGAQFAQQYFRRVPYAPRCKTVGMGRVYGHTCLHTDTFFLLGCSRMDDRIFRAVDYRGT